MRVCGSVEVAVANDDDDCRGGDDGTVAAATAGMASMSSLRICSAAFMSSMAEVPMHPWMNYGIFMNILIVLELQYCKMLNYFKS